MPKMPISSDLQLDPPRAAGSVPHASYHSGASLSSRGRGLVDLGRGITNLAHSLASLDEKDDGIDVIKAEAAYRRSMDDTTRDFLTSDGDYATFDARFSEKARGVEDTAAALIRSDKVRERWLARAALSTEKERDRILNHGATLKRSAHIEELTAALDSHLEAATRPDLDPAERAKARGLIQESLKAAATTGIISRQKAAKVYGEYASKISEIQIRERIARGDDIEDIIGDINGGRRAPPITDSGSPDEPKSPADLKVFAREYADPTWFSADPGNDQFLAQWEAAKKANPQEFSDAVTRWYNDTIATGIDSTLKRAGLPENVANDSDVQTYFSDRMVRYGTDSIAKHSDRIKSALGVSDGDSSKFLTEMRKLDNKNIDADAKSMGLSKDEKAKMREALSERLRSSETEDAGGGSDLTPEVRRRLTNIAKTSYIEKVQDQVDSAVAYMKEHGRFQEGVDANAMIGRAKTVLTPNQFEKQRMRLITAKATHDSTFGLDDRTEADGENWLRSIDPATHSSGDAYPLQGLDPEEHYDIARNIYGDARKKWDAVLKQRDRDPAMAVKFASEVRVARDQIASLGREIPIVNQNEMIVSARLQAQNRLGIPDNRQHAITKREADLILQLPHNATPDQIDAGWDAATQRAKNVYGTHWRRVLEDAIALAIKGREDRQGALDRIPPVEGKAKGSDTGMFSWLFGGEKTAEEAPAPTPNQAQIDWVLADPKNRSAVFDQKFGPGTFAKIMSNVPPKKKAR
jgi:hypothetical protein